MSIVTGIMVLKHLLHQSFFLSRSWPLKAELSHTHRAFWRLATGLGQNNQTKSHDERGSRSRAHSSHRDDGHTKKEKKRDRKRERESIICSFFLSLSLSLFLMLCSCPCNVAVNWLFLTIVSRFSTGISTIARCSHQVQKENVIIVKLDKEREREGLACFSPSWPIKNNGRESIPRRLLRALQAR